MTYNQLRQQTQEKQSKLFEQYEIFFAISEQQFMRNKTRESINDFVSFLGCAFIPKENAEAFYKDYENLMQWETEEAKKIDINEIILEELKNHEAFYTGDIEEAYEATEEYGATLEQVKNIFQAHREKLS